MRERSYGTVPAVIVGMRGISLAVALLLTVDGAAIAQQSPSFAEAQRLEELGHREHAIGVTLFVVGMVALTLGAVFLISGGIGHAIGGGTDPDKGSGYDEAGYASLILGGLTGVSGVIFWGSGNARLEEAQKIRGATAMVGWTWRF